MTIAYDTAKGPRVSKTFKQAIDAKTFYTAKEKAGKNPAIVPAAEQPAEPPAKPAKAPKPKPAATDAAAPKQAAEKKAEAKPARRKPKPEAKRRITVPAAAAQVIHRHGLEAAITDAMVVEVGNLVGRQNAHQDSFVLRQSRLAIIAYLAVAKQ